MTPAAIVSLTKKYRALMLVGGVVLVAACPEAQVTTSNTPQSAQRIDCAEVRRETELAWSSRDWESYAAKTKHASCWPEREAWLRMRIAALYRIDAYRRCVGVAGDSEDPEVIRYRNMCASMRQGSPTTCTDTEAVESYATAGSPRTPGDEAQDHPGPEVCAEVRREAELAWSSRDWKTYAAHTKSASCWPDRSAWLRERIVALFRIGAYCPCVAVAADSRDPEVVRYRNLCVTMQHRTSTD